VLDNGTFHKAAVLQMPENIALPLTAYGYYPEFNLAEKIWGYV